MCADKFQLKFMGGRAEGKACADPGARTCFWDKHNISGTYKRRIMKMLVQNVPKKAHLNLQKVSTLCPCGGSRNLFFKEDLPKVAFFLLRHVFHLIFALWNIFFGAFFRILNKSSFYWFWLICVLLRYANTILTALSCTNNSWNPSVLAQLGTYHVKKQIW